MTRGLAYLPQRCEVLVSREMQQYEGPCIAVRCSQAQFTIDQPVHVSPWRLCCARRRGQEKHLCYRESNTEITVVQQVPYSPY
jgi:hypothetical protein